MVDQDFINDDRFNKADRMIHRYKELYGIPGIVVGVSHNGKLVYSKAVGYSDVENNLKTKFDTKMRIASISKPIACLIAAKLYENGKLDFDKPVDEYLTDLPKFYSNGKEVKITTRQLMCHTSGIRHYKNNIEKTNNNGDTLSKEFYLNKNFPTTKEALEIFINDFLMFEPGSKYLYTSFGYTLLSAVLEKVSNNTTFPKLLNELFKKLDLNDTSLDLNDPLIPNRSRYYMRDLKHKLTNVPYVDNSYKWAGGGLVSNVSDLLKLGNLMLTFYQSNDSSGKFLKQSTVRSQLWSSQSNPIKDKDNNLLGESNETLTYGLGWFLVSDEFKNLKYVYHTGGAVGASSCLMIFPQNNVSDDCKPKGIVVSVLCNSQDLSEIVKFTLGIARIFS